MITSDSGRFRLEVYQRHYKVFDITSAGRGAKIIERSGRNPNFSPTGRFVVAHSENSDENTGGKMEMFDLIAGRDVDFRLRGPIFCLDPAGRPVNRGNLSHYSPLVDKVLPKLAKKRLVPRQQGFLFEHTKFQSEAVVTSTLPDTGDLDWRAKLVVEGGKPVLPRAPNFIQQLTSFGIRLEQEDALDALVIGTKWLEEQSFVRSHSPEFKRSAAAIEQALLKDVPTANDLLNTLTPNIAARLPQEPFALYSNPRIPCSGPDEDQHFDNVWRFREHAHGVWTWSNSRK